MIKLASAGAWYDRHLYVDSELLIREIVFVMVLHKVCAQMRGRAEGRVAAKVVPRRRLADSPS